MACFSAIFAVTLAALVVLDASMADIATGGYMTQDPYGSPKYIELAHFAMSTRYNKQQEYWDTVLELKKVETQVVSGVNYRLTFTTAPSSCKMNEEYSAAGCRPTTAQVKATCIAIVYEGLSQQERVVTSIDCY